MKLSLLGLELNTGSYNSFVTRICQQADSEDSHYNCIANVHMLVEARRNPYFSDLVNCADLVTPDGMPLIVAMKMLYGVEQDRVAGMTLLPDLLQAAELRHIPVFIYGGDHSLIEKTKRHIQKTYPLLTLAGAFSPPFRSLTEIETKEVVQMINQSGARLVFVALGCPKQEIWMAAMKNKIHASMVGVGAALSVMVGIQKRAPLWMQRNSLEWLFRLFQEPRRLFRRYTVTNNIFIWVFLKTWAKQKFKPDKPEFFNPPHKIWEPKLDNEKDWVRDKELEA